MALPHHTLQLDAAKALVSALETGDGIQAEKQLAILTQTHENQLFQDIGKLTRDLHDALNAFRLDPRLVDITENAMPDTRQRLNFVITTTEAAAHKTLELIDNTVPLTQELRQTAEKIDESWHRFQNKEMNADEFRHLVKVIEAYLPAVKSHADAVHHNLSEITLAQGYQDITGQVIRQVISLVEEVEDKLVQLVKVAGQHQSVNTQPTIIDPLKAEGPQINRQNNPAIVQNQDDVDDLLSSLGF